MPSKYILSDLAGLSAVFRILTPSAPSLTPGVRGTSLTSHRNRSGASLVRLPTTRTLPPSTWKEGLCVQLLSPRLPLEAATLTQPGTATHGGGVPLPTTTVPRPP